MRKLFIVIIFLFIVSCVYSQETLFVKGQGYEGFIFSKEYSICGFPPENNRYTPSVEDIARAEKILLEKIGNDYVKSNQKSYCKPPINKRTLNRYIRQYVGYLMDDGTVIIHIYMNKTALMDESLLSKDIVVVHDGGRNHWHIKVNISTEEVFDIHINGCG